ncbi:MAG: glycosyltransferase family 39 protein, partial [Hyphomonadaceae bacterium]
MSRTSSKQKPVKAVTRRGKARTQVRVKAVRPKRRRKPLTWDALGRLDKSAVILLIWIYCLAHWVVRTLIAPVYTVEEAEQLLMSQSLQLGYDAAHPPLLAWIFATLKMWPGLSPPLVFGVKYLLLFSGLTLFYLAARNVLVRPGVSAAAVACWAMTFYIGWGAHEDLLNTVALMACLSMTLHAMTRILTWRRPRDWIYLGVAMGLGLLTSYLYIV